MNFNSGRGKKKTINKALDGFLIKKAIRHLESSDNILLALIRKHGPCKIVPALNNPFDALASSIISQQLSDRTARAIKGRLLGFLRTDHLTPEGVLRMSSKGSRDVGLSGAKLEYMKGLALAVKNGELDFAYGANWEDEEVIVKLTSFKGVGRWTAEMFLIFGLGRPDVLSVTDAGLKRAFKITYSLSKEPSPAEMISISEPWKPYRSVASWYLWRELD